MSVKYLLIIACLLVPFMASAHNFEIGSRVAAVGVDDKGELSYENEQFSYSRWNSAKLPGKVRIVQHMAGRTAAKEMNEPLIEAIRQDNLPRDRYQTTTIVNTDDAIIGTGLFVRNSIESGKKEFPWSQVIVDSNGEVKKAWQLQSKSSAIIVLDKNGMIRFAKEGTLTSQEVQKVIDTVNQLVKE
ncbi:YtfJ family protein [Rouxiella sp. WC2420]|uniref:YtfJ family protein n=1 Tax=Rouxiella sp. WC2420 TaxID=3234145 RepID=A0AB39VT62_9GAMM